MIILFRFIIFSLIGLLIYISRGIEYLVRFILNKESLTELKSRPFYNIYHTVYIPYGGEYKEYDGTYLTFKDAVFGNVTILKQ